MPFEPNHPKVGGRKPGSINKSSVVALVRDRFPDFHPIVAMIEMYHDPATQPELKKNLLSEIASYMIPKVKPVELTELRRATDETITALVADGNPIDTFIQEFLNGRLSAQDLSSLVSALSLKQKVQNVGVDEQQELLSLIKR